MEARKMFEELNLEQIRNDDNYIEYVRNGLGGYISILFSLRWKAIKSTCGYQARGMNYHEITLDELKAIVQQAKELGWLEEKQEIKQETNYEHYKDGVIQSVKYNLAVVNGEPKLCGDINCDECDFKDSGECVKRVREWLNQQYKKPKFKLTQFEYDLLEQFLTSYKLKEITMIMKLKTKGYFNNINFDLTVGEVLDNCEVSKMEKRKRND